MELDAMMKRWTTSKASKLDDSLVASLFNSCKQDNSIIATLEISCYLEKYIWLLFPLNEAATQEHILSILLVCNEKYKEGLPVVSYLTEDADKFSSFFTQVVQLIRDGLTDEDLVIYTTFLVTVFRSLENPVVRKNSLKYVSLPLWESLSKTRLEQEFESSPDLEGHWEGYIASKQTTARVVAEDEQPSKKRKKGTKAATSKTEVSSTPQLSESAFIPLLIELFFAKLEAADAHQSRFLAVAAQLLLDLLSQLPTRRFLNTFLDDIHFVVRCKRSSLYVSAAGRLFAQLVDLIDDCSRARVDDQSGEPLSEDAITAMRNDRIRRLQRLAYTDYPEQLKDAVFSSTGELSNASTLRRILSTLTNDELLALCSKLGVVTDRDTSERPDTLTREFIIDLLLSRLARDASDVDALNQLSLYPNETLLFDLNLIPEDSALSGYEVYPLPKLNLQFLSVYDYLMRNFTLFRLESAYEIRLDLCDAIKRMSPYTDKRIGGAARQSNTVFNGWARMAIPLTSLSMKEVAKPHIGEIIPSKVTCTIEIDLSRFSGDVREEWESLRQHDVNPKREMPVRDVFGNLPAEPSDAQDMAAFREYYGVQYVRGGEVLEMRDQEGAILNDLSRPDERPNGRIGSMRTLLLQLDSAQYYADVKHGVDCYERMNLVVRRHSRENNFKSVLETIRNLLNDQAVERSVPSWLRDILLGYGAANSAHYRTLHTRDDSTAVIPPHEDVDYLDTFLDAEHLQESFPDAEVDVSEGSSAPYRLRIVRDGARDVIEAIHYKKSSIGPYPETASQGNMTRFTPTQVEAIRSGVNEGLTLIVGPPGTGKSDTAVQIASILYQNYKSQKILLITHSNAALNDLFSKIKERKIDPRHLLRLGGGEKDLLNAEDDEHYSKHGRVNWSLQRRLDMLAEVQRLAVTLGVAGDVGYSCETADNFYREHIWPRIYYYHAAIETSQEHVEAAFPFMEFFNDVTDTLFKESNDFVASKQAAESCFQYIRGIFEELADFRAFELLRSQSHRADYLLTKQARIIAMTCTHAAMIRQRLIDLDFKYDSLIVEEAGQILEVETLIPMLLQNPEDSIDACRLKRVVLIGDHLQLPPVVKNTVFKSFSKFDQSLFSRLVRIGVPTVVLESQGRCRPAIANLFSWRYSLEKHPLRNLPVVCTSPAYLAANAGFAKTFQVVDVPAFKGKGESCPTPHFYQNLGEAEYVVAVYQYMRLIGYPKEKITVLTTYNGQKQLIRDILNQRCKGSLFGYPADVATVDKYQGQQNDYILLSLVRTSSVGHLRDIRRLVVAFSRARLGMYIFCRQSLFENCLELSPTFTQLVDGSGKPQELALVTGETYPTQRKEDDKIGKSALYKVDDVSAMGILVYKMIEQAAVVGNQ